MMIGEKEPLTVEEEYRMSADQEYEDWKEDVDAALCLLQGKILYLETKVKQLERRKK